MAFPTVEDTLRAFSSASVSFSSSTSMLSTFGSFVAYEPSILAAEALFEKEAFFSLF